MSEQETLREILRITSRQASTLARVDERTQHILAHQAAQNGKVNRHDERIDHHDVELASLKGEVRGVRSNFKLYIALSGIGVGAAANHETIHGILSSIF